MSFKVLRSFQEAVQHVVHFARLNWPIFQRGIGFEALLKDSPVFAPLRPILPHRSAVGESHTTIREEIVSSISKEHDQQRTVYT